MKCSEQWALHPHENTQFVQNPSFQQWAQIGQDFSSGPFLPADSPIASAPRLSLAVLVYFISLPWLLLYFLPSSWLHSPIVLVFAASQVPLNGNALCWNKGANFLSSNRGLLRRMSMISRSAFLKEKLFFDKTKTKTIKNKQTNKQKKQSVRILCEVFCLRLSCVSLWCNLGKTHLHFCQSISCLRSYKTAGDPQGNCKAWGYR